MSWDIVISVTVPLIAAIIVGGVSVYSLILRSRLEAAKKENERLQIERKNIYIELLGPYLSAFANAGSPSEQAKAVKRLASEEYLKVSYELNFMGSDEVVRAMNVFLTRFRGMGESGRSIAPKELVELWGGLLLAIRRDLGDKKTTLKEVEMLTGHITDIHKRLQSSSKSKN